MLREDNCGDREAGTVGASAAAPRKERSATLPPTCRGSTAEPNALLALFTRCWDSAAMRSELG